MSVQDDAHRMDAQSNRMDSQGHRMTNQSDRMDSQDHRMDTQSNRMDSQGHRMTNQSDRMDSQDHRMDTQDQRPMCVDIYPQGCPPVLIIAARQEHVVQSLESIQKEQREMHDDITRNGERVDLLTRTVRSLVQTLDGKQISGTSHDALITRVSKLEGASAIRLTGILMLATAIVGQIAAYFLGYVHLGAK